VAKLGNGQHAIVRGLAWLLHGAVALALLTPSVAADEATGYVCLGKNHAKTGRERTRRLYLTIDDSERLFFDPPGSKARIVVDNLTLDADHWVRVYFDGEVVRSWRLNFSALGARGALIWRSSGAWRMEPTSAGTCDAGAGT
jgi:hypothetical protein